MKVMIVGHDEIKYMFTIFGHASNPFLCSVPLPFFVRSLPSPQEDVGW